MIIIKRTKPYTRVNHKITFDYLLKNNDVLYHTTSYILAFNKYPYDNTQEHLVLWFKTKNPNSRIINKYRDLGYYILFNPTSEMSVPEINHIHIIKFKLGEN